MKNEKVAKVDSTNRRNTTTTKKPSEVKPIKNFSAVYQGISDIPIS